MAIRSFLPKSDSKLLQWALSYSSQITADPTVLGLTSVLAALLATQVAAYQDALSTSTNESTRTRGTVAAKNYARQQLQSIIRNTAKIIDATPSVTDQQRLDLGLNVRAKPKPTPPPGSSPVLEFGAVNGWTVNFNLHDAASSKKIGRPPGVAGASIFSYVGPQPPADIAEWKFEGNTGRAKNVAQFSSSLAAGTTIWLTAFWFNGRKQSGPASRPVSINLPGGSVSMKSDNLKIAA